MKPAWIYTFVFALTAYTAGVGCSRPGLEASTASEKMKESVQARFADEPALADVRVNADAVHNRVTLSGAVPSEVARTEAVDRAKSISVTPVVVDKINVLTADDESSPNSLASKADQAREKAKVLGDRIGSSLDDAWVYTRVEAKLVQHDAAPALKIKVDVENNVVTLRGEVNSVEMKEEAERIARETAGVRDVRNLLEVRA